MTNKQYKTKVINLIGAAGVGKSTTQALLYAELKNQNINVEINREFIKSFVYQGIQPDIYDQFYILGKEVKQQKILFGSNEYVITDSPIYLPAFYQTILDNEDFLTPAVMAYYRIAEKQGVSFYNFFLTRQKEYNPVGRFQTEKESNEMQKKMLDWLGYNGVPYYYLDCPDEERVERILRLVK